MSDLIQPNQQNYLKIASGVRIIKSELNVESLKGEEFFV